MSYFSALKKVFSYPSHPSARLEVEEIHSQNKLNYFSEKRCPRKVSHFENGKNVIYSIKDDKI
jgi:hypothetical protein